MKGHLPLDISVTPDFTGLPPNVVHGLITLSDNAAALLMLISGLGIAMSLIGWVFAHLSANRELAERAKGGLGISISAIALLYIGIAAANYAGHLFQ